MASHIVYTIESDTREPEYYLNFDNVLNEMEKLGYTLSPNSVKDLTEVMKGKGNYKVEFIKETKGKTFYSSSSGGIKLFVGYIVTQD